VRVSAGVNKGALLVPQPAVIEVQGNYQLIVITPENKATFRPVKMGERVGTDWIVAEGVKPGERVVVEGIQKVQLFAASAPELMKTGGVPVVPKPYVAPTTQAAAGSN
jgi:membrane fusion protein (multidrug efflux system)